MGAQAQETARDVLAALVGFPTIAGCSNEELITFAAERLQSAGARVDVTRGARTDGLNLHAVLGPADVPGLLLSAHTDVVAVDGQAWSSDPFTLREADGRLYGRGTADMKGFIAALLAAVARWGGGGRRPGLARRPLHVILSSDEELGCVGIRPLLATLPATMVAPELTIVGEPTRLAVATRHKGKLALRVTVHGRACHSGRAPEGVNAVEYAARLISALVELGAQLRTGSRDERFAVPHTTLSTGPIRGGVALNIVPDLCTFDCEVRPVPRAPTAALRGRIEGLAQKLEAEMATVDDTARITVQTVTEYPGLAGRADDPAAAEIARLAGTVADGALDFGTEAGLIAEAFGAPVLVCGPGDMAQAHRPDEYLELTQLDAAQALITRLLERLSVG
ncbi:MAG: acetylornithine deacetylase [Solirubrobacteraceae bacterium]